MAFRLFILFLIVAVIEIYAFQAVKTFTKVKWVQFGYIIISLVAIVFIVYQFTKYDRSVGQTPMFMITIGLMLLVLIPKLLITSVLLLEDVLRLIVGSKTILLITIRKLPFCQKEDVLLVKLH